MDDDDLNPKFDHSTYFVNILEGVNRTDNKKIVKNFKNYFKKITQNTQNTYNFIRWLHSEKKP